ncbi:MAG: ketol-acid reductoisomerase [Candidatus Omnitrophica bacterium]|nr:ketol-acid reductoisomerase [Candidatus Omnitrophota bacterium]
MPRVYTDKDADLKVLKGKKIAVIGYGAQGRAQSLNLRDSGLDVIVSDLKGSANWKQAVKDKFKPVSAAEAAKKADIIQILTQDHVQAKVYCDCVEPNLIEGNALVFSHGFNIHFKQITPPNYVDVFMIAPKGPGTLVREMYEKGMGVPCLVAIFQEHSGNALDRALAYAKGIGGTRAGVIETTFKEETETDLFGEQAVLCGGVTELIKAGFDTLVDAGYQPEIAYFECCHELKLITDLIYKSGLQGMREVISDTAEYGDLSRGPVIINKSVRSRMKKILKDIQSGKFAKEWMEENRTRRTVFNKLRKRDTKHRLEIIGKKLRGMMSWIGKS